MFDFAVESLNEMRNSRRQREAQRQNPAPVRVQVRPTYLAVAATNVPTDGLQTAFAGAFAESLEVTINGATVTLQGRVASDYDRALAEKMAKLQPGVDQVNNQLTIKPPIP